jgi:hypothetical protein
MAGLTDATVDGGFTAFQNINFLTTENMEMRDGTEYVGQFELLNPNNKYKIFQYDATRILLIEFEGDGVIAGKAYFSLLDQITGAVIIKKWQYPNDVFLYANTFVRTFWFKQTPVGSQATTNIETESEPETFETEKYVEGMPLLTGGEYLYSLKVVNNTFKTTTVYWGTSLSLTVYYIYRPTHITMFQKKVVVLCSQTVGRWPSTPDTKRGVLTYFFGTDVGVEPAYEITVISDIANTLYSTYPTAFALYTTTRNGLLALFSDTLTSTGLAVKTANASSAMVSHYTGVNAQMAAVDGAYLIYADERTFRVKPISSPALGAQAYVVGDGVAFPHYQKRLNVIDMCTSKGSALALTSENKVLRCSVYTKNYGTEGVISETAVTHLKCGAMNVDLYKGLEIYGYHYSSGDFASVIVCKQKKSGNADFVQKATKTGTTEMVLPAHLRQVGLKIWVGTKERGEQVATLTQADVTAGKIDLGYEFDSSAAYIGAAIKVIIEPVIWLAPSITLYCAYKEPVKDNLAMLWEQAMLQHGAEDSTKIEPMAADYFYVGESERFNLTGSAKGGDRKNKFRIILYPRAQFSIYRIGFEGEKAKK